MPFFVLVFCFIGYLFTFGDKASSHFFLGGKPTISIGGVDSIRTYWHYIYYMEGGFSISLRAYAGLGSVVKGVGNLARHFVVDKSMNALFGSKWKGFKEDLAQRRAETALAI